MSSMYGKSQTTDSRPHLTEACEAINAIDEQVLFLLSQRKSTDLADWLDEQILPRPHWNMMLEPDSTPSSGGRGILGVGGLSLLCILLLMLILDAIDTIFLDTFLIRFIFTCSLVIIVLWIPLLVYWQTEKSNRQDCNEALRHEIARLKVERERVREKYEAPMPCETSSK